MPATIKAVAAAARAFTGGAFGVPLLAGGVALEQKSVLMPLFVRERGSDTVLLQNHSREDRNGRKEHNGAGKSTEELPAHEMPFAPKNN